MNANRATDAAFGDASLQSDQCERLIRQWTGPGSSSACARWRVEDRLAAQMRAQEPVCGEEPEAVEGYMAWLSEDLLRELDALERRAGTRAVEGGGNGAPVGNSAGGSAATGGNTNAEAEVWLDPMEVFADIVRASVDHANGVSREERVRDSSPYAEWDEPPPFCSQSDFAGGDYFGGGAW